MLKEGCIYICTTFLLFGMPCVTPFISLDYRRVEMRMLVSIITRMFFLPNFTAYILYHIDDILFRFQSKAIRFALESVLCVFKSDHSGIFHDYASILLKKHILY